jgi:hypothetical protein
MSDTATFLAEISSSHRAFDKARSLYAKEVAPEFSALVLLKPSETDLSRILAWMLNPRESHCQGAAFLHSFLDAFGIDRSQVQDHEVSVRCEEVIEENGRVDISIKLGRTRKIVVENKPFAADQRDQLKRYLDHVGPSGYVIYLPGEPREPTEFSISEERRQLSREEGRLIESSWVALIPFFERCANLSAAPRVRRFIEELPRYVTAQFQGITDMTETLHLISQMTSTPAAIEASFLVANSLEVAKKELLRKLGNDVQKKLSREWNVTNELDDPKSKTLWISYPGLSLEFYAGFETNKYGLFSYGLGWVEEVKKLRSSDVQRILRQHPAGSGATLEYPWWSWADEEGGMNLPRDWAVDHRPWQMILDGTAADRISNAAQSLFVMASSIHEEVRALSSNPQM